MNTEEPIKPADINPKREEEPKKTINVNIITVPLTRGLRMEIIASVYGRVLPMFRNATKPYRTLLRIFNEEEIEIYSEVYSEKLNTSQIKRARKYYIRNAKKVIEDWEKQKKEAIQNSLDKNQDNGNV